jgi:hypothetical protein
MPPLRFLENCRRNNQRSAVVSREVDAALAGILVGRVHRQA